MFYQHPCVHRLRAEDRGLMAKENGAPHPRAITGDFLRWCPGDCVSVCVCVSVL